ncbi:hypothetical protein [Streptomyces naphthomycinicus]|uniref:hypothetical protein n=1 Tax=Streptomyces naphthomycinicus TaxID=2872625 RepID=UPI001CED59DE|nr:hypothetical protein [Streptomyces sp. TML10]
MRDLPARRLASTVLCAAVLIGITGPAAVAADAAREHGRTASRAPVPAAEKERLLAQVRALDGTSSVLDPVIDLLDRSLENGRLPADQARKLGEAAKKAVVEAAAAPKPAAPTAAATPTTPAAPATAATPTTPAAPTTAATPTTPAAPTTAATPTAPAAPAKPSAPAGSAAPVALTGPAAARHATVGMPASRDLLDDALDALETAIDNLVKAVTDGLDQVLSSASDLVSDLVDLLTSTLLGDGLSAPSLTDLPSVASPTAEPNLTATG